MPLVLPIEAGLRFNNVKVSDHNRSALDITPARIENKKRMADGTMRTFIVATKKSFKFSWSDLPRDDHQTADGFRGAKSLKDFFDSHPGSFSLTLNYGNGTNEIYTVLWDTFSIKVNKRSAYTDLYDIDCAMDEV